MKPRRLILILAPICALLIAYPLSFGPAFSYIVRHPGINPTRVMDLYLPLLRVCGHSKAFNWYVGLWLAK